MWSSNIISDKFKWFAHTRYCCLYNQIFGIGSNMDHMKNWTVLWSVRILVCPCRRWRISEQSGDIICHPYPPSGKSSHNLFSYFLVAFILYIGRNNTLASEIFAENQLDKASISVGFYLAETRDPRVQKYYWAPLQHPFNGLTLTFCMLFEKFVLNPSKTWLQK